MKNDIEKLISVVKQQAEAFLLDAREFYPFGTYINAKNEIVPVGAYLGSEYSPSLEVIDLLERAFNDKAKKGDCIIGGIAVDVTQKVNDKSYDAIEIRFFEPDKEGYKKYFRYEIKESSVEFIETN